MTLERDVYKALDDIVGEDYISEEPALLDAYALHWGLKAFTGNPFGLRHEAVLLPGNTEEVQAIVKICNRHGIKFKALSTGWGSMNGAGSEGVIQLDMRRMNRILEINEKAMYAVVEPYVICAQLQAELMKRGLNCHIISAGSNTSALPLTALMGSGPTSISTSYNNRNILGVEWVMPDGEIVRLGSLGAGAGWFCGDGPGPSLRGIMRGYKSPLGGLGVFTAAATKVYHWPGPEVIRIEGASPGYIPDLPDTITAHYITFPSWGKLVEAGYKIGESEIAIACDKMPPWMMSLNLTENGREGLRLFSEIRSQTVDKGISVLVIMGANTQPELDYKEKVLRRITSEAGGEYLPLVEDPTIRKKLIWHRLRATTGARETFRFMLSQGASFGACDSWEFAVSEAEEGYNLKRKYIENGSLIDDGIDYAWGTVYEHGHLGHMDELYLSDPAVPASGQAAFALMQETMQACIEKSLGCPQTIMGDRGHDVFGPSMNNYHLWARKIKKVFDPNGASDSSHYISAGD
jgi:glycolate oxidase